MINEIHDDANSRMDKTLSSLEGDFSKIRAGRAHPSLLEQINVEYYGTLVPISQVSNIISEDSRTLKVSPWEKDMVGPIEKAIMTSDLGLNPNTMGQVIRIPLPLLTEERRKELVKIAKSEIEDAKISIRNSRKDANNEIKKIEISTDQKAISEKEIQTLTDNYITRIDEIFSSKEKEILSI